MNDLLGMKAAVLVRKKMHREREKAKGSGELEQVNAKNWTIYVFFLVSNFISSGSFSQRLSQHLKSLRSLRCAQTLQPVL